MRERERERERERFPYQNFRDSFDWDYWNCFVQN